MKWSRFCQKSILNVILSRFERGRDYFSASICSGSLYRSKFTIFFFRIEMNEIFIKILRSSSDTPLNGKPIKIIVTWLVFVSRDVHALLKYTKCTFYKFTMVCNSCIKTTLKWRHHDVTSLDSQLYHVGHCHCPGR